ncbi:MAG: spondin domain-containing protein [Gemmatimonadetes bacterium]|nr:spondin domain-containing protein [Gemmatimonadota bacterium]
MRKLSSLTLAILAIGACAESQSPTLPEAFDETFDAAFNAHHDGPPMWEVRITNLTAGQPFTPPIIATHTGVSLLFRVGKVVTLALREIAENGNLTPMVDLLTGSHRVGDWTIVLGATAPPVMPGEEVVTTLSSRPGARRISFASMLICTNDGFTGLDAVQLPGPNTSVTLYTAGYDAGSEVNTEDFADIVPPCPPLTGVPSTDPGTGVSDPALAENGVIHHHGGIQGGDDLNPAIHGWTDPVAKIVITRIN